MNSLRERERANRRKFVIEIQKLKAPESRSEWNAEPKPTLGLPPERPTPNVYGSPLGLNAYERYASRLPARATAANIQGSRTVE